MNAPYRFTYEVEAQHLRPCNRCGTFSAPFPTEWSPYCSWCVYKLYLPGMEMRDD